jgi:redox-sensitive bicupin YhaK (pirin superfamily)
MNLRTIESRWRGAPHGFITRLISPGYLGERLKPFVFLDHLQGRIRPGTGFGFHPHSGIATLTYQLDADVEYEDTAGQKGRVRATGLEWMQAGGGTWHQGFIHPRAGVATGFQLWVSLPPALEEGPAQGRYLPPDEVPQVGNVRVLLGSYGGAQNPIPSPSPISYLDVVLGPGETWEHTAPAGHSVAWCYIYQGAAEANGSASSGELLVFDRGDGGFRFRSQEGARLLFGSAQPHQHPLVLGSHSVHTSEGALERSEARIEQVAARLHAAGRL